MELLVAMVMSTILLTAIVAVYFAMTGSYSTESARTTVQQNIRDGLALMAQDIRMAGLDPMGTAGSGFTITESTDIEYITDLDFDGAFTANNNERVRYYLNGNNQLVQILDNDSDTEQVLLENVSALNFDYVYEDGATTPSMVVITMTVEAPAGREGSVSRTLTEQVRIRNV
jgi:Tfp pilus assembly protein PilW